MRVFKFGGASVKDAFGVQNLASIVKEYLDEPLIVVVSAMGKTTNLLELICDKTHRNKSLDEDNYAKIQSFHLDLAHSLFSEDHDVFKELDSLFNALKETLNNEKNKSFDFYYDQVVSYGEMISTKIIHHFLLSHEIESNWIEAGAVIKTNSNYKEGRVDWDKSAEAAKNFDIRSGTLLLTQGFLGESDEGFLTTLGREGSDYTAAILAYVFNADKVVIWKDVPGMLNADPRRFPDAVKLNEISFKEAIELSYFGATVIHPKTLQPLKEKNLPLFVKSFVDSKAEGSVISGNDAYDNEIPSYILKDDQILISITPQDLTFVVEENLSDIFSIFSQFKVKIHLMQNSALSFSVCVDYDSRKVPALIEELSKRYKVKFNVELSLLTVRHYNEDLLENLLRNKKVIVEQKTRHTARFVYVNEGIGGRKRS